MLFFIIDSDASSPELLNAAANGGITGQEVSTLGIVALKSELKGDNNSVNAAGVPQNHSTLDMLRK